MTPERMHEICAEFRRELPGILDGRDEALQRWAKQTSQYEIQVKDIIGAVAAEMQVTPQQIKSNSRHRHVVRARQLAICLARDLMPHKSIGELAIAFSKSVSTIDDAFRVLPVKLEYSPYLRDHRAKLLSKLK